MSTIRLESQATPLRLEGSTILVVEDDPDTLDTVTIALEQAGARVTGAPSATAAIRALDRQGFDMVVTDYALGRMTGYELLRHIRAQPVDGRIPVLCYSAYSDMAPPDERSAFTAFAAKPDIMLDLVETVRRALS